MNSIVPLAIGAFILASGIIWLLRNVYLVRCGVHTSGKIIALKEDDEFRFEPTIEFVSRQGHTVIFVSKAVRNDYRVGQILPILYHPSKPQAATLKTFHSLWFMPCITSLIGLVFLLIGLG